MQTAVTIFILLLAVSYLAWRLYLLSKGQVDPCDGCALKKNCKKFCQYKEK